MERGKKWWKTFDKQCALLGCWQGHAARDWMHDKAQWLANQGCTAKSAANIIRRMEISSHDFAAFIVGGSSLFQATFEVCGIGKAVSHGKNSFPSAVKFDGKEN